MNCFLKVSIAFFLVVSLVTGCAERRAYSPPAKVVEKKLAHMGYTIQVGAFSHVENAVRLTDRLRDRGFKATYFAARVGLYKVSFGNYPSKMIAREKAENLKLSGVIDEYHIVTPDEYAIAKQQTHGNIYIREELIKTAQKFIAVPYLWGGSSSDAGFDCSGLAMTVYQLNGLDLPRSSKDQYEAGTPVERDSLLKGDLVFFATSGRDKVTHVGIYVGEGRFIHAPGRGKNIRVDPLSRSYYKKRYIGGRAYL
ncbi:MAG: NlpC/P60 family protein [Deltaproteobacteria bacterium]|nr:NlpC/P60 family protein [Deltaproteobacteria bacterium]